MTLDIANWLSTLICWEERNYKIYGNLWLIVERGF